MDTGGEFADVPNSQPHRLNSMGWEAKGLYPAAFSPTVTEPGSLFSGGDNGQVQPGS